MGKKKIRHLILGAGITGLSCAYHLGKEDFLLFEKERSPGGFARSHKTNGFTFDYSAHLLHYRTSYFYDWIRANLDSAEIVSHKRKAWIYSHGVYTKYPFQANLYGLPRKVVKECLEGLWQSKLADKRKAANFEDWCLQNFGYGISRHFMIPYNKKFWTVDPRKITAEWIDGFVPRPCFKDVLDGTFEYGAREFGYHSRFFYSRSGGMEPLINGLSQNFRNKIISPMEVKVINLKEKRVETVSGEKFYYENLVSTIPLPELAKLIPGIDSSIKHEFTRLRFVSLANLNLGIARKLPPGKDWIYFPEKKFIFYRVGFYSNIAPKSVPDNCGSLYVDISYSDGKTIDKKHLIQKIISDLIKADILQSNDKIVATNLNHMKYAYVLYDHNWNKSRNAVLNFLKSHNIFPAGRFGAWHYLSMEGCFLEGRRVSRLLAGNF